MNDDEVDINGRIISTGNYKSEIQNIINERDYVSIHFTIDENVYATTMQRLMEQTLNAGADRVGILNQEGEE